MRSRDKLNIDDVVMVSKNYTKWLSHHADEMHSVAGIIKYTKDYRIDAFSYSLGLPLIGIVVNNGADKNIFGVQYTNGKHKAFQYFEKKDLIKLS